MITGSTDFTQAPSDQLVYSNGSQGDKHTYP